MAKANLLKTETRSYLELIGNGKTYRVPAYQRDYSWGEEQWDDLWGDINDLITHPNDRHYMGALVVEGQSDREFLIIDGQQRIATLSLLALAVLWHLRDLAARGIETEANTERMHQLRARFIGEKDPANLSESSKLFLNATDDAFYQDYLVQLRAPLNPRGLPVSNRALWQCFSYFKARIADTKPFADSGEKLARLLNEAVARQLIFILITVEDDLNAYTVFETLNARGLELSATDLLKNYLFARVRGKQDQIVLGRRWQRLVTTVRQDRFPEFLRYHLLCEIPKIRQQRLFKLVRERVKSGEQVFALIDQLEARAELFAAAGDADHGYWKDRPEALPSVRELILFRVRQHIPVLFAGWQWPTEQFVKLLRLISVFSFRYIVVGGLNPNDLEPLYHQIAKSILAGVITRSSEVHAALRELLPSDDKFERDFAELSVETSGQSAKLTRYILCNLSNAAAGTNIDWNTDPGSIEHILPENPGAEWDASVPTDRQEQYAYRLGNLILLEKRLNRDAGNRRFEDKLGLYAQSAYPLTRALHEHAPHDWTIAAIEARQAQMAKKAKAIWKSDFSGSGG